MQLDDCVLCRIYKRHDTVVKTREQNKVFDNNILLQPNSLDVEALRTIFTSWSMSSHAVNVNQHDSVSPSIVNHQYSLNLPSIYRQSTFPAANDQPMLLPDQQSSTLPAANADQQQLDDWVYLNLDNIDLLGATDHNHLDASNSKCYSNQLKNSSSFAKGLFFRVIGKYIW